MDKEKLGSALRQVTDPASPFYAGETLVPFIYCCEKCGTSYHTDRWLADTDPRVCQSCQSTEDENETRLCQWCAGPVGPSDILCDDCKLIVVCYAEMPAPTQGHPLGMGGM